MTPSVPGIAAQPIPHARAAAAVAAPATPSSARLVISVRARIDRELVADVGNAARRRDLDAAVQAVHPRRRHLAPAARAVPPRRLRLDRGARAVAAVAAVRARRSPIALVPLLAALARRPLLAPRDRDLRRPAGVGGRVDHAQLALVLLV